MVESLHMQATKATFFGLPAMNEALVEGTNDRVAACGGHRRHVQDRAYRDAPGH